MILQHITFDNIIYRWTGYMFWWTHVSAPDMLSCGMFWLWTGEPNGIVMTFQLSKSDVTLTLTQVSTTLWPNCIVFELPLIIIQVVGCVISLVNIPRVRNTTRSKIAQLCYDSRSVRGSPPSPQVNYCIFLKKICLMQIYSLKMYYVHR